ncbi:MAG: DNA polymerase III subunit delta' [Lachnospiraceae bacterium]|nr:DNA polymerase III subunit delta' [Lachnospiraceae bacterium]
MVHFKDICGNTELKRHFMTALRTENISHAYLISGEQGSGKNMFADAFSAALLCTENGEEPCGRCKSCIQAQTGNHPDIIRVTHEKSVISVDDIREQLNSNVVVKPYSSEYKVFIVDEAELMNEAAQNALLKTLEEPPEYVVILLLSESEDVLLPTIRSRCVRLNTRPLPTADVVEYLTANYGVPDYRATTAAAFSGGNLGAAIAFITTDGASEERTKVWDFLRNIDDLSIPQIADAMRIEASEREEVLDLFSLWLRDVLVFKSTGKAKKLILQNEVHSIEKAAKVRSFEALDRAVRAVDEARRRLKSNVNADISLEMLALKLRDR